MKIPAFIIVLILLLPLGSCSNWLDITPEDNVDEEDLFATGEGYRNALNGVYRQMAGTALYGQEMSWGLIEVMGQLYANTKLPSYNAYGKVVRNYAYEDETVKPLIQNIWSGSYNAIANCNNIIGRISEEDPVKFRGGESERELIRGEALALRAMLHFDLLRLFAPAPATQPSGNYIPYFETYPSVYEPDKSVAEVLSLIERDLIKGRTLVADFDTLPDKSMLHPDKRIKNGYIQNAVTDLFFLFRGYRMNYYAITGMLARVYLYQGEYKKAYDCAEEVINAFIPEYWANCFPLTNKGSVEGGNRKCYQEVILGLSNQKNTDHYYSFYTTGNDQFILADYEEMFDDNSDVRKVSLTQPLNAYRICNKYVMPANNAFEYVSTEDLIPLLRVSEMYYVQAEYLCREGRIQEAVNRMDDVRAARNCTKGRLIVNNLNDFKQELIREMRREFMQEGQLFFCYKRLNVKPLSAMPDDGWVFPLPDNEVIN